MTKEPHPDWTEVERWAWERIQSGEVADFNEKLGETADPAKPEDWGERRTLNRHFLEALVEPPWREHVHRKGIRVAGALLPEQDGLSLDWRRAQLSVTFSLEKSLITGKILLGYVNVIGNFSFANSRFDKAVDMTRLEVSQDLHLHEKAHFGGDVMLQGAKVGGQFAVNRSRFDQTLNMHGIEVGQDLFLHDGAHFGGKVSLHGAKIDGRLAASGSRFEATLDMQGLKVGQDLFLNDKAHFGGKVDLTDAKVDGRLDASGSRFEAALNMHGIEVGQDLFLHDNTHFGGDVSLNGAKIDGQLGARGSRFEATLDMQGLKVGQDLFLDDKAHFGGKVDLLHARIGGGALVCGSVWHGLVDMTGARLDGELHLASSISPVPIWGEEASLVLRNAHLGALQDSNDGGKDAWPKRLDLHGCRIDRLGGTRGDDDASDMLGRPGSYWVQWLARGTKARFSPQPYQMIARLLREAGYPAKANTVLYAARCRERDEPRGMLHKIWMWFLCGSIGFGIGRYFATVAGLWFLFFVTAGTAILDFPTKAPLPSDNHLWKIAASADRLIPFAELVPRLSITLNETLHTWQTLYFAFHSLLGWVLAAMVVAGLAGLTQRA